MLVVTGPADRSSGEDRSRPGDTAAVVLKRLFQALARGDQEALASVYEASASRIFGLALWRTGSVEDASDVVQEVFLRLAARRHELAGISDPLSWLLTVAHHSAVDLVRRRRVRAAEPLDGVRFLTAPETGASRSADGALASALLARLPGKQRDVIYLRHFADATFATIGRITGVPTFTAASRYRLGIARLRRLMEGKG